MTLKIVDESFKPKKSKKVSVSKLLDEIEELKERNEELLKERDEYYDELEKFKSNSHDDYEVIDKYEYQDNVRDRELLDEITGLQEELKTAKERASLGIEYANYEIEELLEKISEVI